MYTFRLTSFLLFTTAFWLVEMGAALTTWAVLSHFLFPSSSTKTPSSHPVKPDPTTTTSKPIKPDPDTPLESPSATSRTFPTYGRQPPLRYAAR